MKPVFINPVTPNRIITSGISKSPQAGFLDDWANSACDFLKR